MLTCAWSAAIFALVVAMLEVIWPRWYWAASKACPRADIWFCAAVSSP